MFKLSRSLVTSAWMLSATSAAFGQSQSINGTIRGRAIDPSGASVSGATVTVTNAAVGATRTITTGSDGYYTLINLPLGDYSVVFAAPGFSTLTVQHVVLNAGTEAAIDGALQIGGESTSVNVTASNVSIDPTNLNIQRTLDSREVENLPLTSRNPYNYIIFQPGVSGHPNAELGIPRTINTNGLLDRINYQMDGMVNTQSDRIGLRLFPIGNIFVKEVQTVSNSFAPEYGWTTGDVYNVLSNNGTNQYHGMFQYLQRWQDLTAFPLLTTTPAGTTPVKPNLELEDYSGNVGGPILKDRLFFFGSYEQLKRGVPAPVTITQANAAALGLGADQLVSAPGLLNGKFALGRLDWTINAKNQAFLRYNYFINDFPFNTQVGGLNARSTGSDYKDRAHVFGAQIITTINDHIVNEFRISLPLRANAHTPSVPTTGPAITITGVASIGASANAGDQYFEKQPSGSENISYIRGRHNFKAGFTLSAVQQRQRLISFNTYTFANVANYLSARSGANPLAYSQYSSQQDRNGIGYASLFYGGYGQDTWQVSPRLVAVFGLRYDRFQSPNANPAALYADSRRFNIPNTNFAPRLGFSFRAHDKTILKASAGIFYQATPTNLWFNALNLDGSNRTSSVTYSPTQAGAPTFPNIPTAVNTTSLQNVTTVSPSFKNEYTWNINAQLTQQLSSHDSFTLGYILSNGRNLMYQRNVNLQNPIGSLVDGRSVFNGGVAANRPDARFNRVDRVESGANSSFNALVLNYTLTAVRGLQLNANYTWSHTLSDAPEVNTFEQSANISDTTNRKRDRGNSYVNRPNAFNVTAVLEPQFHIGNGLASRVANGNRFAILGIVSSGDQANVVASVVLPAGTTLGAGQSLLAQLNGDASTTAVQRPAFVGRNTYRSPNVYQLDARYTRTFPKLFERIEPSFVLEANNLLNHTNVTTLAVTQQVNGYIVNGTAAQNANAGRATALAPVINRTTSLEARIVQWGAAVRF